MEYSLGYGWAILVVIVVGIVLWQLGIMDSEQNLPATFDGFVAHIEGRY